MQTEIKLTTEPNDDVKSLVMALDQDLSGYAAEQHHGLDISAIFAPNIRFYLAFVNDKAVGCGGIAFYAEFAELKRMYVDKAYRGENVAAEIIQNLEKQAKSEGIYLVKLETGNRQLAAIKFYAKHGYNICQAFAPYTELDPFAIETSIFMEKHL